jgi:DNA-binding beta-propeller fold protein YncE
MRKLSLIVIGFIIVLYLSNNDFKFWVNGTANSLLNSLNKISSNGSGRDKYGLLASDYDKNGWAKVNGKWVSNPREGASIKYSGGQVIATSSKRITNTVLYRTIQPQSLIVIFHQSKKLTLSWKGWRKIFSIQIFRRYMNHLRDGSHCRQDGIMIMTGKSFIPIQCL